MSDKTEAEAILTSLSRQFATPVDHYRKCPECRSEEMEEHVAVPCDGQNIEIHVLKRCTECDWMRAGRFTPEISGRPPAIQPETEEADEGAQE